MGLFKFKSQYEIDLERIKNYASFFTQEKIKILDDTENWHDTVRQFEYYIAKGVEIISNEREKLQQMDEWEKTCYINAKYEILNNKIQTIADSEESKWYRLRFEELEEVVENELKNREEENEYN